MPKDKHPTTSSDKQEHTTPKQTTEPKTLDLEQPSTSKMARAHYTKTAKDPPEIKCTLCDFRANDLRELVRHLITHDKRIMHMCLMCNANHDDETEASFHFMLAHQEPLIGTWPANPDVGNTTFKQAIQYCLASLNPEEREKILEQTTQDDRSEGDDTPPSGQVQSNQPSSVEIDPAQHTQDTALAPFQEIWSNIDVQMYEEATIDLSEAVIIFSEDETLITGQIGEGQGHANQAHAIEPDLAQQTKEAESESTHVILTNTNLPASNEIAVGTSETAISLSEESPHNDAIDEENDGHVGLNTPPHSEHLPSVPRTPGKGTVWTD